MHVTVIVKRGACFCFYLFAHKFRNEISIFIAIWILEWRLPKRLKLKLRRNGWNGNFHLNWISHSIITGNVTFQSHPYRYLNRFQPFVICWINASIFCLSYGSCQQAIVTKYLKLKAWVGYLLDNDWNHIQRMKYKSSKGIFSVIETSVSVENVSNLLPMRNLWLITENFQDKMILFEEKDYLHSANAFFLNTLRLIRCTYIQLRFNLSHIPDNLNIYKKKTGFIWKRFE